MRELILGLALSLVSIPAHAATMQVIQREGNTRLVIDGDINVGDGDRFLARVASVRPIELEMNSPGGDGDSGMAIARWVHENSNVKVFVSDYCNSACSLAALVALGRGDLTVNASSSVGVHQAINSFDGRPGKADVAWTKQAADTLRNYGAPEEPLLAMVGTPPSDITDFDAAALEKMGATVVRTGLLDLPDLSIIPLPALPSAPDVTAPLGVATLAILILILLFGLTLAFRRLAAATNKGPTMKFNSQIRRDRARGLEVNYTTLKVAYVIEGGVILAAFYASYQFANRYVSDEWQLWIMAIIGGVAVALAETARIFLAKSVRTQTSFGMQALATVGLVCMCIVTTKAMAQVMEQTYSPRLRQVQQSADKLKLAEAELRNRITERSAAVKPLDQAETDVKAADANIEQLNQRISEQGAAPANRAIKVPVKSTCRNKRGEKYRCTKTVTRYERVPWVGQQFADQLPAAIAKRDDMVAKRDAAQAEVSKIDSEISAQEKVVAEAKSAERDAVANSQLHSFTAMVFGKDPVDVSDAEVHWFLRFFVLIPAVMIAVASSILAIVSYARVEPGRVELRIADEANTLTHHIDRTVKQQMKEARSRRSKKPARTVVDEPQRLRPNLKAVNNA